MSDFPLFHLQFLTPTTIYENYHTDEGYIGRTLSFDIQYDPLLFSEPDGRILACQVADRARQVEACEKLTEMKEQIRLRQQYLIQDMQLLQVARKVMLQAQLLVRKESIDAVHTQGSLLPKPKNSRCLWGPLMISVAKDISCSTSLKRTLRGCKPRKPSVEPEFGHLIETKSDINGEHLATDAITNSGDDKSVVSDNKTDQPSGQLDNTAIWAGTNNNSPVRQFDEGSFLAMAPNSEEEEIAQILCAIQASLGIASTKPDRVGEEISKTIVDRPKMEICRGRASGSIIIRPKSDTCRGRTSRRNYYQDDSGISLAREDATVEESTGNTSAVDSGKEQEEEDISMTDYETRRHPRPGMVSSLRLPTKRFEIETASEGSDESDESDEGDEKDGDLELAIAMSKEDMAREKK